MNPFYKTIAILAVVTLTGCTGANLFRNFGSDAPLRNTNASIESQPIDGMNSYGVQELAAGTELDSIIAESNVPVLLDFYADWCGPCQKQGRILHDMDIAANQARVIKVNVDEHPEIARRFGAESIPLLVMLEDGKQTYRKTGVHNEAKLNELLQIR